MKMNFHQILTRNKVVCKLGRSSYRYLTNYCRSKRIFLRRELMQIDHGGLNSVKSICYKRYSGFSLRTCTKDTALGSGQLIYQKVGETQRSYSSSEDNDHHRDEELVEKEEQLSLLTENQTEEDSEWEDYILPEQGHNIIIIQPDYKEGWKKVINAELHLAEACALVEALPRWKVVHTAIYSLKGINKKYVYAKGNFKEISSLIHSRTDATAVFFAIDMLTGLQLSVLQNHWGLPVYDRYTMVLQIFKLRAQTQEAKLQVALAEIPYYRSRLVGLQKGTLDQQRGSLGAVGGSGEKQLELRARVLQTKEAKLRQELNRLKDQRHLLQTERKRKEFPLVAVVGYTNAGKTSLIKSLTGKSSLQPWDQVFATLDVTCHGGTLPNHMRVLYLDTVGFISDIPTPLIQSFAATLADIEDADVIVHVRDISHPDTEAQRRVVMETLQGLNLPKVLLNNTIEVCNKVDLISESVRDRISESCHCVSALRGHGLLELSLLIQDTIIRTTHRLEKRLKIPLSGPHLNWLYKEADVTRTVTLENDTESLIVEAVMTEAAYAKFCATFKRKKASYS